MLRFTDFAHLPEIDGLVQELIGESAGLIVVAGLDSRPALEATTGPMATFLPSGRATIFRVLVSELLEAHPTRRCVVVGQDRDVLHIARRFKSRVETILVKPPLTMDEAIRGHSTRPGLLVIDRLTAGNLSAALAVARAGGLVVSQLDTLYCGAVVARHLLELGAAQLVGLEVQRVAEGQLAALGQHPGVGLHRQGAGCLPQVAGRGAEEVEDGRVPLAARLAAGGATAGGEEGPAVARRVLGGQGGEAAAERLQLGQLLGRDGGRLLTDGAAGRVPGQT